MCECLERNDTLIKLRLSAPVLSSLFSYLVGQLQQAVVGEVGLAARRGKLPDRIRRSLDAEVFQRNGLHYQLRWCRTLMTKTDRDGFSGPVRRQPAREILVSLEQA